MYNTSNIFLKNERKGTTSQERARVTSERMGEGSPAGAWLIPRWFPAVSSAMQTGQ